MGRPARYPSVTNGGTHRAASPLDALGEFEALVRGRRTNLLIDLERQVDESLVERLCGLINWAPNHKRTWPWQVAVFTGPARAALGNAFADDQAEAGEQDLVRIEKARRKYLRAPVCVVVGSAGGDSTERTGENRDAVSAGIQNLLLGATAVGLASFWSTPPGRRGPRVLNMCGFAENTELIGVIYLGWPKEHADTPERPPLGMHWVRNTQ